MKNMIYIYGSTLLIVILNFIVRKVFLDVLTVDYLGYDSLFTSIFSLLSLSEMGIATIITYQMYSEIATNNVYQIRKLLYTYKLIYKIVGAFVLFAGAVVSPFIPLILKDTPKDSWAFIYAIYFLQLLATLCTYFLAYRRILFITYQRIYVCTLVDTVVNIVSVIAKMMVLLYLRNYIIYLLIAVAANVTSNLIISQKSKKEFPEITSVKVTKEDIKQMNLFHDIKNMMATKIAGTIYGCSDDIIITYFLGITTNGLVNNYKMITSKLQEFIISLFSSLQASIGNLVYDKETKNGIGFFKALDLLGFLMGIVISTGLIAVGQPFILLWLKSNNYLLPYTFLIALSVNIFIAICNNPINYFRNTLGHFETDRNYMIAAAIVNIVFSILLSIRLGITGVIIATVMGHLLIFMGRTVVVFKYYINEKPTKYYLLFLSRLILLGVSSTASVFVGRLFDSVIANQLILFLIKGLVSVIISLAVFCIANLRSESFNILIVYFKKVIDEISKRKKHE